MPIVNIKNDRHMRRRNVPNLKYLAICFSACEVVFDNTPIPVEIVFGVVGGGFKVGILDIRYADACLRLEFVYPTAIPLQKNMLDRLLF